MIEDRRGGTTAAAITAVAIGAVAIRVERLDGVGLEAGGAAWASGTAGGTRAADYIQFDAQLRVVGRHGRGERRGRSGAIAAVSAIAATGGISGIAALIAAYAGVAGSQTAGPANRLDSQRRAVLDVAGQATDLAIGGAAFAGIAAAAAVAAAGARFYQVDRVDVGAAAAALATGVAVAAHAAGRLGVEDEPAVREAAADCAHAVVRHRERRVPASAAAAAVTAAGAGGYVGDGRELLQVRKLRIDRGGGAIGAGLTCRPFAAGATGDLRVERQNGGGGEILIVEWCPGRLTDRRSVTAGGARVGAGRGSAGVADQRRIDLGDLRSAHCNVLLSTFASTRESSSAGSRVVVRSEATRQAFAQRSGDCFAPLAMTVTGFTPQSPQTTCSNCAFRYALSGRCGCTG